MGKFNLVKLSILKILLVGWIGVLLFSCTTEIDSPEKVLAQLGIISEDNFCADFDSDTKNLFCDKRDGRRYKFVPIGANLWMAENLNYKDSSSVCYEYEEVNCVIYGRLYNWNSTTSGICPSGWSIPSDADWESLAVYAGLKANSELWEINASTGQSGFLALPGGEYIDGTGFVSKGSYGNWWSATPNAYVTLSGHKEQLQFLESENNYVMNSVRCVRENLSFSSSSVASSSSSSVVKSSSSSVYIPPPLSSASCTDNCTPIPEFTCTITPDLVMSGDPATININITGDATGCTKSAFVEYEHKNSMGLRACDASSNLAVGVSIATSGKVAGTCVSGTSSTTPEFSWPTSGTVAIKGAVICGIGTAQNTEVKDCAITILDMSPIIKGSVLLNADYPSSSSGYFYIGTIPKITHNIEIINNDIAKCGAITTELIGNTAAAGTVKAIAYATCRGTVHELSTASATVVPDPTLNGTCSWSKNPTNSAKGAIPSGVSLTNSYGRCGSIVDGALPVSAYSGGTYTSWPADGLVNDDIYSVSTNVHCVEAQKSCPELTVNAGADYTIECIGAFQLTRDCTVNGTAGKTVILKIDECVDIAVLNYTDQYLLPSLGMTCTSNGTYTLSLKGMVYQGTYHNSIPIGKIEIGDNEFGRLCLETISGTTEVSCTGPEWL